MFVLIEKLSLLVFIETVYEKFAIASLMKSCLGRRQFAIRHEAHDAQTLAKSEAVIALIRFHEFFFQAGFAFT